MTNEVWRVVEDYPNYSVSNLGRVRRDKPGLGTYPGRILKTHRNARGYHLAYMCWDGKRRGVILSRIVCIAFHGRPPAEDSQVDHLDFDTSNNRADNLEWVSPDENHRRRFAAGRGLAGERNNRAKLTEEQAREIKARCANGESFSVVASDYGVSGWTASQIASGRRWGHLTLDHRNAD